MFRRAEVFVSGGGAPARDVSASPVAPLVPVDRPNLSGDLGDLLDHRPLFHVRRRGYDRLEVDNYVAWAETELGAAQRQAHFLLTRYGACSAELAMLRREHDRSPAGRDRSSVGERVGEILRLAADEAAEMIGTAADEADQMLAEARLEADARLRKAQHIREAAVAAADHLRELAQQDRTEAGATLEQARREAEAFLRSAAAERDRQASAAAARLAAVREEVDDLRRQRDEARQSLHRLTDQIGEALRSVVGGPDALVAVSGRGETVPT